MSELHEHRLKRLKMRSMRRGIKEMDLILTAYADDTLHLMDEESLANYDDLLNENDQDLYQWVTGQVPPPERFEALIARISVQFQGGAITDGCARQIALPTLASSQIS